MGSNVTRDWPALINAARELLEGIDDVAKGDLSIDDLKEDRRELRTLLDTVDDTHGRARHVEHLLSTALAYQATYAGKPTDDPYVQTQRDANDAEIERLRTLLDTVDVSCTPTPADTTDLAAEIHGEVSSALNTLHEVLLDGGDSQEAWEDAAGSLASVLDGLVTREIGRLRATPTPADDEPTTRWSIDADGNPTCDGVTIVPSKSSGVAIRYTSDASADVVVMHTDAHAALAATVRAGVSPQPEDERCPFIVTTDDATSYCSLAASAGPAPTPERPPWPGLCPSCGTSDAARHKEGADRGLWDPCPDPWHSTDITAPGGPATPGPTRDPVRALFDAQQAKVGRQKLYDDVFSELSMFEGYDGQDEAAGDALHDLTERVLALLSLPAAPTPDPQIDWQRMYLGSVRVYGDLGIGVMQQVAEGATLPEVLDFVADHLNGRDHVDDESIAIYERAKAELATAPTPGPTHEQVLWEGNWGHVETACRKDIDWRQLNLPLDARVRVVSLFGSACAPPAEERERERVRVRDELTPDDLDGGYVAECVSLPGCVSQGDTVPEALVNLADAYTAIKDAPEPPEAE